jgi:hypothetical protein
MRVALFSILFLLLLSCRNRVAHATTASNDTSRILEIALLQGTSAQYMPAVSPLQIEYKFGDSILLTSNALPLNILPMNVGANHFKIMNQDEICFLIKRDSALEEVPNYLIVSRFEKKDTGYYVQVQSLSGRPYEGGGSLGLYLKIIRDSLIVVRRMSFSIN